MDLGIGDYMKIFTIFKYKNEWCKLYVLTDRKRYSFLSYGPEIVQNYASFPFIYLFIYFDLSKKSKPVKAIYVRTLKVLITLFQKMIWFIGVWATV